MEFMIAQRQWPGDRSQYLLRDDRQLIRSDRTRDHDDELVAAQSRYAVALAQAGLESRRHFLEQQIARLVAERVVDVLEAIEIDKKDRELPVMAICFSQPLIQDPRKHAPIGEARELVVEGEVLDLPSRQFLLLDAVQHRLLELDAQEGHQRGAEQPRGGDRVHLPCARIQKLLVDLGVLENHRAHDPHVRSCTLVDRYRGLLRATGMRAVALDEHANLAVIDGLADFVGRVAGID